MTRNIFRFLSMLFLSMGLPLAGFASAWAAGVGSAEAAASTPALEADTSMPFELRRDIENALKDRVSDLLKDKNAEGVSYKRGTYSKSFRKVDDTTCKVTFHVDTAEKSKMTTQRFLLTLKQDSQNKEKWKIVSEELQDTYSDVYRPVLNEAAFHRFDGFHFDKEGLKASGTKGSLYEVYRNGKIESFIVTASDLYYAYTPPSPKQQKLWEKMKRDHPSNVIFKPDYLRVGCDPVTCEQLLSAQFAGLKPASLQTVDESLRSRYQDRSGDYTNSLKDDYFRFFSPPPEPDRREWNLEFDKGDFKPRSPGRGIRLSYDNWEPREVSFDVYSLYESFPFWQTVYAYYSEETRKSAASPTDLERRDDFFRRDYDLQKLAGTVEMGIDDSELMTGDLTFALKTKRELKKLPFFITRLNPERPDAKEAKSPRMFVNSIQDGSGRELTFVKLGSTYGLVILPEPVPANTNMTLRMQFQNRDAIYKLTPTYSYVSRGGWLPFVHFGDMTDFDLTVKVPAGYTTLGIGKKLMDEVKDGVRTTRWVPDFPISFPTVIYGDYYEAESNVKAVKGDGTPIPVVCHVDRVGLADWQIPPKSLDVFADEAANALNLYRAIFGVDYPYSKLDLVNDPLGGLYGQAPSSIVYLGSVGFHKAMLGSFGAGDLTKFVKGLVPHEVAHQWWGSLITNANGRNYWWVESLAEFSAALFVENVYSREQYLEKVNDWRKRILETDIQVSVQDASEVWGGDDFRAYQAAVYSKGPYAFHVLRTMFGDDKFFAFLKALAQELKGKEIVTRDIQRVAEKAFGGTMEWFFDEWLRGVGLPEFKFTFRTHPTEDGKYIVEGEVEQRVLVGKKKDVLEGEYFRGRIPITLKGKNGKESQCAIIVDGPKSPFKCKVPESPEEVTFNKYGETLAYDIVKGGT